MSRHREDIGSAHTRTQVHVHSKEMLRVEAQAEGVELKDVVNLAFHECFERRQYLPEDRP